MADDSDEKVVPSELERAPIPHSSPLDLQLRINRIARVFPSENRWSRDKWVQFYLPRPNTEEQVATWEAMATAYSAFTKERPLLSPAERKEAFQVLLLCSKKNEPAALDAARRVSQADARKLIALFHDAASASKQGFPTPAAASIDSGPLKPDRPGKPSGRETDEPFTI